MICTPPANGRGFSSVHIDWPEYFRVHTNRTNLLLLLFAVSFAFLIICGDWPSALIAIAVAIGAMALQGRAHRREAEVSRPFMSLANFLRRWFSEQFVIFPVFVLTGRWWCQYRVAGDGSRYQS